MRAPRSTAATTVINNLPRGRRANAGSVFFMSGMRSALGLLVCFATGPLAFAHDPGLSSAHVVRTEGGVVVQLALAWPDLASLASATTDSTRPGRAELAALGPALAQSTGGLVRVYAAGVPLQAREPVVSPGGTSAAEVLISLQWSQVPSGALRVEFPVLTGMPFGHRTMLTVGNAPEPVVLLDARHPAWDLPAASAAAPGLVPVAPPPARASWLSFVLLGVEHILTGFDHLCFLFALLLVATRFRDVLAVVTTFTVAHSLTLAAAAFGAVAWSSSVVEPLIAASIVYIGLENIFLRRSPRHRLALVFGFGLVHGLGFAGALAERLPGVTGGAVVPPLLGFNAGVELGQLAVAACLVPLIGLARARPEFAARLQPACSLAIATAGVIWFIQRV